MDRIVNGQALILAYSDATMLIAYVALLGVPFVLLMRKPAAKREAAAPVVMPASGAAHAGPPTSSQQPEVA